MLHLECKRADADCCPSGFNVCIACNALAVVSGYRMSCLPPISSVAPQDSGNMRVDVPQPGDGGGLELGCHSKGL
jgi:hypothetical protein